ncbi:MAG: response regulator [Chloroflexota bacterium]
MTQERYRLLVVDDEETIATLVGRRLAQAGFTVDTANSGEEALSKMAKADFCTVLTDIRMPGMSGIDLLRCLIVEYPATCVIMVTAVDDAKTAVDAMKMGAYDYVTKPFDMDDVVIKVRRAIEKRDSRLESELHQLQLEKKVMELAERIQHQFAELVETLAREHKLLNKLAERQKGSGKFLLSKLPPELQTPMSSAEEFSEALLKILKRGALKPDSGKSTGNPNSK